MACGCKGGRRAGSTATSGQTVKGYEVTYSDGTKAPGLFDTPLDAKLEVRRHGGGTIRTITS